MARVAHLLRSGKTVGMTATVSTARSTPKHANAVGVPVATSGAVPRALGLSRAALAAHGFEGKPGQTLVVPAANGATQIAVGVGDAGALTPQVLRNAAAALVRAASKHAVVATSLADLPGVDAVTAAQAVTEGGLLASYRYAGIKKDPNTTALTELVLVAGDGRAKGVTAGVERGVATAAAGALSRDLANTPPSHMNARHIADKAVELGAAAGLT
ncbi:MAG: cytosol aminopeptidase, partial [Actinomycetota bacterium]